MGKKRDCPNCIHWDFDRMTYWCKKDLKRITHTTANAPYDKRKLPECKDFEPWRK